MDKNESAHVKGPKPISKATRFWHSFKNCRFAIMSNKEDMHG
jgi:hypothetical protein